MDSDLGCTACSGWGLSPVGSGRCRCCHGNGFHLDPAACHAHVPWRPRLRWRRPVPVVGLVQSEARFRPAAVPTALYHHEGTGIR
jgi:hypothetical protein